MALAWQGTNLTGWLGENRLGSLEEQQLLGSTDEGHATSKSWMDADHSDAEQQSSTVLRKRHCDDLAELESDCWAQEQQEQQQARQQSHVLKRVCSGLTSTSCEAGSAQPCWAHSEEQQLCSEPCSPGAACPSEASAPHCSARADTPTGSSPAGAAAAAADGAQTASAAVVAAASGIKEEPHNDAKPQQGKANTRASSSRSAAAKGASAPQDSAPAASSRASSKRQTRKPSDTVSASQTNKAGGCLRSSKASKGGIGSSSGSSSGSSACKGPRVRLGGRLLSQEEAEKYLKEVAAAAQAAAAKVAAAKAAAAEAAAAKAAAAAATAAAPAVVKAEPGVLIRPPSPSLDAIAAAPATVVAAEDGTHQEAALAASAGASTICSPLLATSAHGSSLCQMDVQAAAGSTDHHHHHQQQELPACQLEPMAVDCAAAGQPELGCSSSALQQQHAAAVAAMDALGVDVDDDDLDLSMLPDQVADQLPENFVPTPHQSSGWPSLESTLGGLDMRAAAAAAEAALIGSACSAAGCNADSLAAAVQEEEAAQQQQQLAFTSSPFLMSGPCSAAPGSLACPSSPLAAAAAFRSMRRDSSSARLCETALLQRGSYNSSMSSSSLVKSCSVPIRLSGTRPDSIRLAGPSGLSGFSGPDASSLAQSGSASLSGPPGCVSSSMPINMSRDSISTMHGASGAAMPAYDPAAAAAAAVAQQEEDRVDAELQQLLAQWSPDDTPAAAAAAAPVLLHQAISAPAGCGGFSQQLSCSFPQQQMSMPLSMQGQQLDMSLGLGSNAVLPSAVSGASGGFVGFAAPQSQQQASTQLAWKPAFAAAAPHNSSSGALSVTVPISVPAAGSAVGLQCDSPFTSCSAMQGSAPVQIAYPAGRQPRARKGKGSGSKASQQQQAKKHQQQQQLTMQLQVPASALPAAVPPGARVVLHLKANQQQQLMAVVDRLVQQRLVQTYEAGYRAATQDISSMGTGSMPPPPPVHHHQGHQGQMQMPAGLGSSQMELAPGVGLAGGVGSRSMSMGVPAGASLKVELHSSASAGASATAAGTTMPQMMVTGAGGVPGGHDLAGQQQQLLLPAMPRQSQLVDDILPSMQDLLTDCCE